MWRITDDFWDNWILLKDMFHRCELWQNHVAEGCYPDCDMLPLGYLGKGFGEERVTNFTKDEQQTMLTLWCLFGSPLMLGCELTKLDEWTLSLLTNKNILNLLSPDCKPKQIYLDDTNAIWFANNNKTNKKYVALFNLGDETINISINLEDLDIHNSKIKLTNLWTSKTYINLKKNISKELAPHTSVIYEIN